MAVPLKIESCVPLPLDDDILTDLVEKAKDFSLAHGICMRRREAFDRDALHFAPFLLLPSVFSRDKFEDAVELQPLLNELVHKVAHDRLFLEQSLKNTIREDDFTGRLYQIHHTVLQEGVKQTASLGLFRSDYFLDCDKSNCKLKQVEFNTVASSFAGLSTKISSSHKYVFGEMGRPDLLSKLPENRALQGLAGGMLKAWQLYGESRAVVLFVVEDVTYNICDQKFHEFEIRRQNPDVYVIRKTLTEVAEAGRLSDDNRLMIDRHEVAVIYFRSGYHPDHYPSDREWNARLMMERSLAIKCPSIHYHLAGTKKVQQELARPGVLEKFFPDQPQSVLKIRSVFCGLYSLDEGEEGDRSIEKILRCPEKFVLKPQREGGGNNIYGNEVGPFLQSIRHSSERNAFIAMDRIITATSNNYMVRPGQPVELAECINELGIFGLVIDSADKILVNEYCGHMVRTKLSHVNEGGVAAGLGALDSVFIATPPS